MFNRLTFNRRKTLLSAGVALTAMAFCAGAVLMAGAPPAYARSISRELRICQTQANSRALEACSYVIGRRGGASIAQMEAAYSARAEIHARLGDVRAAAADFERAVELNPEAARLWLRLGQLHLASAEIAAAESAFARAEALAAGDLELAARALIGRGEVLRRQGQLDGASSAFQQAIYQSDDDRVRALGYLGEGRVRAEEGDRDGAVSAFMAAARRDSASGEIQYALGAALAARASLYSGVAFEEDSEAAVSAFERALGAYRESGAGARSRSGIFGAIGAVELERHRRTDMAGALARAERAYAQAVDADPANADALAGRAAARAASPNGRAAALADMDAALRLRPSDGELYRARGDINWQAGEGADAMRDYDAALQRGAANGYELYIRRGRLYLQFADYPRAHQSFDRALALAEADTLPAGADRSSAIAEALLGRAEAGWRTLDAPGVHLRSAALAAVADADRAAREAPSQVRYEVGRCLARVVAGGHWDAARVACRAAVEQAQYVGGDDLANAVAARALFELKMALAGPVSASERRRYLAAAEQSFGAASDADAAEARSLALFGRSVAVSCQQRANEAGRYAREALALDRGVAARFEAYRMPRCDV
jgi:tetratricopeptide (TPR) repeat protein